MYNKKRFKLREEFFGALIYDILYKNYIFLDDFVLTIIKNYEDLTKDKEKKIYLINNYLSDGEEFDEIVGWINNLNILNNYEIVGVTPQGKYLTAPLRIYYDITYKCNLNCKHCFTESGKKHPEELNFEQKKVLIDQMKAIGTFRLSIAGGEPLIDDDFFAFITYARKQDVDISFTTNGNYIDMDIIDKLNRLEIKTITLSIDGGRESSNDYVRGKGQFKKALHKLHLLKEHYNGTISLKTTLMKINKNELDDIVKIGENKGCKVVKFNCIRDDGRANKNKELLLTQDEYIEVVRKGASINNKNIKVKMPLNIFDKIPYYYIKELGFGCFAAKESICVDPIGNVRPCSHMPDEFIAGNILENDLLTIWNKSEVLYKFRNLSGNKLCNNCEEYDFCRGGCRYRALLKGDINGVDPYCYLKKNIVNQKI